jgi:ABC-type amino acid transport substrate-binding protein
MKRLLVVMALMTALLSFGYGGCSSSGKIKIATDATWPPFEYVDESNNIVGFDIDLMNAIAQKEGLNVEYINVGFDPLLAGMAVGTYDAAISSITIKPTPPSPGKVPCPERNWAPSSVLPANLSPRKYPLPLSSRTTR